MRSLLKVAAIRQGARAILEIGQDVSRDGGRGSGYASREDDSYGDGSEGGDYDADRPANDEDEELDGTPDDDEDEELDGTPDDDDDEELDGAPDDDD
jgi:hypothetical protein